MKSPSETLSSLVRGLQCVQVVLHGQDGVAVHFEGGTVLLVAATSEGLRARVKSPPDSAPELPRPTRRQHEYLTFIGKYVARYGRAPAEADIERHFLVSAPSVNQMMQTLEKHGFISRQSGVPRSTKLRPDLESLYVRAT